MANENEELVKQQTEETAKQEAVNAETAIMQKKEKESLLEKLLSALRSLMSVFKKNEAFSVFQEEIMKDVTALQFQTEVNAEILEELTKKLDALSGLMKLNDENLESSRDKLLDFINENTEIAHFIDKKTDTEQFIIFDRDKLNADLMKAGTGLEVDLTKSMMAIEIVDGKTSLVPPQRFDDIINPCLDDRERLTNMNWVIKDFDNLDGHLEKGISSLTAVEKRQMFVELLTKNHEEERKNIENTQKIVSESLQNVKDGKTADVDLDKINTAVNSLSERTNKDRERWEKNAEQQKQIEEENRQREVERLERENRELKEREYQKQLEEERRKRIREQERENSNVAGLVVGMYAGLTVAEILARSQRDFSGTHTSTTNFDKAMENVLKSLMTEGRFLDGKLAENMSFDIGISGLPFNLRKGTSIDSIESQLHKNYSEGYPKLVEKVTKELEQEKASVTRPYNDFGVSAEDKKYVEDRGQIHQFNDKGTAENFKEEKKEDHFYEEKDEKEDKMNEENHQL